MTQRFRVVVALVGLTPGTYMVAHSYNSRGLTYSFGLLGQQAHIWYTNIYAGKHTHAHT